MKLKKRGYILFEYWNGQIQSFDFCKTFKELQKCHDNNLDDKWDLDGRNKINYFYLDMAKGKFIPLNKWANNVNKEDEFKSDNKLVLSTKTF